MVLMSHVWFCGLRFIGESEHPVEWSDHCSIDRCRWVTDRPTSPASVPGWTESVDGSRFMEVTGARDTRTHYYSMQSHT